MRILTTLVVLATLSSLGSMPAWAQAPTCGSCPSVGFCPPTFPFGAGPGEQHGCENHSFADASFSNLSAADLTFANLFGIDLAFSNLSAADLTGADLTFGILGVADFTLADLGNAKLTSADLTGADLSGANLTNAGGLDSTVFGFPPTYDCATNFTGTGFDPVAAGWTNLSPCGVCVAATETIRLGTPPNPNAFLPGQTSGPVIGQTWDPVIDHTTFMPGAIKDFVAIAVVPTNIPTGLGTVLCGLAPPIVVTEAPGVPFALPVPNNCGQVGATLCTQGGSIDGVLAIELANALDITIGTF